LFWPIRFTASFELSGAPGEAALRGVGALFLMWNIPYAVALWHPVRRRVSLYEATAMQAIALLGEMLVRQGTPPSQDVLRTSLLRFIAFDGAGLALLILAIWLARRAAVQMNSHTIAQPRVDTVEHAAACSSDQDPHDRVIPDYPGPQP
jgi:hypothetical protein